MISYDYICFQAQSQLIVCSECGKKYKTRGGFERHKAAKHSQKQNTQASKAYFTPNILYQIVTSTLVNLQGNKVFSASLRKEFMNYGFEIPQEDASEFCELKTIYEAFRKNKNAEKLYGAYYAKVPLNATRFFKGLSRNASTLLSTKVADGMIAHCKREASAESGECNLAVTLSEKEKAGLQYVGGYVLHKLHKKHSFSSSAESQQAMSILKAGKQETNTESQKLVSVLNRGGLWSITGPAQKIFIKTEHYFRQSTSKSGLQKIDVVDIAQKSMKDCDVISNFNLLLSDAEFNMDSHVCKDVLHSIVSLYVRVRSFSFARDKIQRHKIQAKQGKSKALRKEISRSCDEKEQQRLQ